MHTVVALSALDVLIVLGCLALVILIVGGIGRWR